MRGPGRWGTSAALVLCAAASSLVGADRADGGRASITVQDLRRHVRFLASDDLRGRDIGEPGIARAEEHIAAEFRRLGLRPLGDGDDYFVDFTLYREGYDRAGTAITVRAGSQETTGVASRDFRPFGFSGEGSVETEVVFAGYGITAPEYDYDDYAGLDVEGRFVLVLRHEPGENDPDSNFDGTASTDHALFATKGANARKLGAAGMLLVTDPLHHPAGDDMRLGGRLRLDPPDAESEPAPGDETGDEPGDEPFLAVHITRELARAIVSPAGRKLEALQRAVDRGQRPAELPLREVRARLSIRRAQEPERVRARNVAALLEGGDPERKHEWIVVGGHHDHLGAFDGRGDTVFNGADDNASGTAGVLELAEAFARRERRPRRSLLFVTFSAEEKGLLGSRAMVEQSQIDLDKVVFMLNLDMIGRNPVRPPGVFGDGYVRGLREIVEAANGGDARGLRFGGAGYAGNSDHDAFYRADVPFLFFFTGTHDDYHQLGDHVDKLSFRNMESIVRLAYGIVDRLAEADASPVFIHHVDWLGLQVEVLGEGAAREARITGVDDGSRAADLGLRTGDALLAFGDEALEDPAEVGRRFRGIEPGSRVELRVRRGDGERTVAVERARVGYLGVFPAAVDEDRRRAYGLGDDEGLVLRQVVPDGPSGKAGLKQGDILIRIDGQPVGRGNLRSRLSQIGAGETVTVQVVRNGKRIDLELTLGERPR